MAAASAAVAAKYQQDDGEADRPTKVCAEAGRRNVRNIHQYPVLSAEWLTLVDSLKQLARLVQLEGRMPTNAKVGDNQGRVADSEGTLWDQEAHENAIRILVEEAKVNLCLRMMIDFKAWQRDPQKRQATIAEAVQAYEYSALQLEQKCVQFEESLGLLLMKSFQHVETLQLMDIPLLLEHITVNVDAVIANNYDTTGKAKLQEHFVLRYFSSVMKFSEKLNSAELIAKTREHGLLMKVTCITLYSGGGKPEAVFGVDVLSAIAEGLAALADNEDFQPDWESFFGASEEKARFLELEDVLVKQIITENPARKKDLRPLLDFFNKIKRKM